MKLIILVNVKDTSAQHKVMRALRAFQGRVNDWSQTPGDNALIIYSPPGIEFEFKQVDETGVRDLKSVEVRYVDANGEEFTLDELKDFDYTYTLPE